MTMEDTSNLKIDPRIQFRCSSIEERDFFQNEINRSGMKPQQYFKAAVEAFKMQSMPEENEQKKVLAEVDALTNRLNHLNRSQLMIAFEMQEQAKNELQKLNQERREFEEFKKSLEEKLNVEFEIKKKELEEKYNDLILHNEEKQKLLLEENEKEILSLRDTLENQEAKISRSLNEYSILQKQFNDKNKLNIAYEEREFDSKKRIMELEERLKKSEINAFNVQKLENENAILIEKNESLKRENDIKIDMLNKQIDLMKQFHFKNDELI